MLTRLTGLTHKLATGITAWARRPRLPRTRIGKAALAAVLVLVLAAGSGFYWLSERSLPDGAAFAVGEEVVSVDQLNAEVETLRALYGVQPPTDERKLDDFRRRSAKAVAVSMVLDRQAKQLGVQVPDRQVRNVLDSYIEQQMGPGPDGRDQFVQVLGNVGTSERAVLTAIRRQLAVNALFNRVTEGVEVKQAELRGLFPQYRDRLGTPERRRIANIVTTSEQQARQVLHQLRGGADFGALAKAVSADQATRNKGGDLGVVTASQLQGEYGKIAFAAKPRSVFGPVHNQFGWNVGRVDEVSPARPALFDEVQSQLWTVADFDRRAQRWQSWLRSAIHNAEIRYADEYRPADPEAPPAAGPQAPSVLSGQPGNQRPDEGYPR